MQDGVVVHDEKTQLGKVPARARRLIGSLPKMTEEDDLAGVSALMTALPGKDLPSKGGKTASKKARRGRAKKKPSKPKKVAKK